MRLFSILQGTYPVVFTDADGKARSFVMTFGEDPQDSSVVRLRIVDPDAAHAIEMEFARNGRQCAIHPQPKGFLPWDRRDADVQETAALEHIERDAAPPVEAAQAPPEEPEAAEDDAPAKEPKRRHR